MSHICPSSFLLSTVRDSTRGSKRSVCCSELFCCTRLLPLCRRQAVNSSCPTTLRGRDRPARRRYATRLYPAILPFPCARQHKSVDRCAAGGVCSGGCRAVQRSECELSRPAHSPARTPISRTHSMGRVRHCQPVLCSACKPTERSLHDGGLALSVTRSVPSGSSANCVVARSAAVTLRSTNRRAIFPCNLTGPSQRRRTTTNTHTFYTRCTTLHTAVQLALGSLHCTRHARANQRTN